MIKYTDNGSDYIRATIGKAVFQLLKNTDFDEIKVADIYKTASVGKTTYYRYFGNKSGKKDAMFFFLLQEYNTFKENNPSFVNTDECFMHFMWSIKTDILLLNDKNCLDVFDRLILSIYGPTNCDDTIYVKYMGAGMWMGFVRALISDGFNETLESITQKMQLTFLQMLQKR